MSDTASAIQLNCIMKTRKSQVSYTIKEKTGILEPEQKVIEPEVDPACPICQEPVGQKTPEGTTESWSELPCGHRFGSSCIKRYLGIVADDHPQCPICRERAYYSCNHPVLPRMLTIDGPINKQKHQKTDMTKAPTVHMLEHSLCEYCRQSYAAGRTRQLGIWGRFYRLFSPRQMKLRLQRRRETMRRRSMIIDELIIGTRPTPQDAALEANPFRKFSDNGWALWWAKQQPITDGA
ncbi:hypothetical protein QBC38DRAFT_234979 [Podospora fimiseda]|uniref:RING-type domain-containing protein n=1 Tax=Podospora fimiseda TaxID=252190 RepID=A0AAN7BMW2_9PEZI|nr:hypothetical protein QBC38DRAFT_234979 [Podospora fimiseda]